MGDGDDDHDENRMMRVVMITVALLVVRTVKPQPSNRSTLGHPDRSAPGAVRN